MDLARPDGGRPGTQLLATGETKPFTGIVRTRVMGWTPNANADNATARLRPRYRDDVLHTATGEAYYA